MDVDLDFWTVDVTDAFLMVRQPEAEKTFVDVHESCIVWVVFCQGKEQQQADGLTSSNQRVRNMVWNVMSCNPL
jgi:hypothetical protein